jgi:hypothetical protein
MAATAWRESNDAGRRAFSESNYSQALFHYSEAIDQLLVFSSPSPASAEEEPRHDHPGDNRNGGQQQQQQQQQQQHLFQKDNNEHQILLSNVIACRLKIGGIDMAEKAVEEAKQVNTSMVCDQISIFHVDILVTHFQ